MKSEIESIVRKRKAIAIIRGFAPDVCLKLAEAFAKGVIAEPAMHFRQAIDLLKSKAVDPDVFLTDCVTFDTFEAKIRDVLEQKIAAIKVCLRP